MAKRRSCGFCGDDLPADARPNRKFCDDDCRRGRSKGPDPETTSVGVLTAGVEESIETARKEKRLGSIDAATVAALRMLARKIDEEQARWEYCLRYAQWAVENGERPPKPPPPDNVHWAVYLNYCAALGFAPSGRKVAAPAPKAEEGGGGSKLGGHLASVPRPGSA